MYTEQWISKDYEKNIKLWYQQVKWGKSDTLYIRLVKANDFLELQNFFLICLKEPDRKLNLEILCESQDEVFQVRHYLYVCRELAERITINGIPYMHGKQVHFFKILPLISINEYNFQFLSMKIDHIESKAKMSLGEEFLKKLEQEGKEREKAEKDKKERKSEIPFNNEELSLLITALSSLYGKISGLTDFAKGRREFFEKESFKEKVRNMPFIAFLIFAVYDRVYHQEIAEKFKEKKGKEKNLKIVTVKREEIPEAMPLDEEIEADMFNAWDLSDGILQLLENVVEHAIDEKQKENSSIRHKGVGVLSIRIHENSEYLQGEYDQYFKGYENTYRKQYEVKNLNGKQDRTEKEYFSACHAELQKALNKGRFVEEKTITEYNSIRERIEKRRREREGIKYFLDIRISDMSGKNMCDVFKNNLIRQEYPHANEFDKITIRSFFDPTNVEETIFEKYYKGKNIIHHYGLQIFTSVVVNNDGFFYVRSHSHDTRYSYDTTTERKKDELDSLFEGTRYKILLPFRRQPTNTNTMINADISYNMKKLQKKGVCDRKSKQIIAFYDRLKKYNYQIDLKENIVRELTEILQKKSFNLFVFDISKIDSTLMEIFCKALILFIAESKLKSQNNIAIVNCKTQDFVNIIRFFAVCYDKNGSSNWMNDTQVYLSGEDTREEFLLSGGNVSTLLVRVNKLAFSRKIHPMCIQTLQKVLEKKRQGVLDTYESEENTFKYTPFDLLLYKEGKTLFENNVKIVLENNIQNIESGCKIESTHTRIGSKIHIDTFYEAELLFYNSYYTNRFAYLIFGSLEKALKEHGWSDKQGSPICFVGYETYSEMLLCELKRIWQEQYQTSCVYVVYEIRTDGTINLRYKELIQENMQYVFVVPINTTLTTFNKVHAEIKNFMNLDVELPVLANLGVIQIRDRNGSGNKCSKIEKVYWNRKNIKSRRIYSTKLLGKDNYASFLVDVQCTWEDPLQCKQCFPEDCIFEMPLIETNKTSVVPTQLIGLRESISKKTSVEIAPMKCCGNVESLKDYLYYGHISRGANHFRYYIRTANYFKHYQSDVKNWLVKVKDSIYSKRKTNVVSFDIIVNPMHFSNTAFVEAVNEVVFDGASYVLRIETEKEFRDNIQTKYSDLSVLYENLVATGNITQINFYYVDDNIITGKAFHRIKHLVNSIFPVEKKNVKVFTAVIVLLNRLSKYSISNYVDNIQDYYAYLNLDISNLRSFEDACYLCKSESDNRKLSGYASTNIVYRYWKEKAERYQLRTLSEIKDEYVEKKKNVVDEETNLKENRYFLRMLATNKLNQDFGNLGIYRNDALKVYEILVRHLDEQKNEYEAITSCLYVSASPFIVYRKSCREAIFRMVLILLETFINEDSCEDLIKRIDQGVSKKQCTTEFADDFKKMVMTSEDIVNNLIYMTKDAMKGINYLKLLIKLSVDLKSNYIIRQDRISKIIFKFYDLTNMLDKKMQIEQRYKFKMFYIASVKRLIALNADESKNTRFEQILCSEIKKLTWNVQSEYSNKETYLDQIKIALYLENTSGIVDAIKNLEKKEGDTSGYFFENYLKILQANGLKEERERNEISSIFRDLYNHLNNSMGEKNDYLEEGTKDFHKYIDYYNQLAKLIKKLVSARNVQFLLAHDEWMLKVNEIHDVVLDKETFRYEVFAHSENTEVADKLIDDTEISEMIENLALETIAIQQNYVIIKYSDYGKEHDSYFQSVYMLIAYAKNTKKVKIDLVKRILLFRNMMIQRFENDFYNNVMQNWIKQSKVIEQIEKARAFIHTRDNDDGDNSNVWLQCKAFFYGKKEDIEQQEKEFGMLKDGYILELMTDIRIGRINLLLLSNSMFRKDIIKAPHKFLFAKGHLECLKRAYYWKDVCICDVNGEPRQGNIIDDEVYESYLEKNQDGYYNLVNEYLIYLIYETIHSAAIYGKKEMGKVHISIYKEGIYLYICNAMRDEKNAKAVYDGIARKGKGISLAVVCEYFIKEYKDRYVRLYAENGEFKIGLPIFTEDEKDGAEDIFNRGS